ncbi:MAG: SDR family oxidoreductase [Blastochloris sp.]|nr:SDR family oxidoreductase [Blastochloris sp.]
MNTFPNFFDLRGRRALVTGSSRGIGAALAQVLAQAGADVMVHYTGHQEGAASVVESIRALGRVSGMVQADLGEEDAVGRVMRETRACVGDPDIVVSNVAIQVPEPWLEISMEHFDRQVRTNWRSALQLVQESTPAMIKRKWGRILTIGSVQEAQPHPQMLVYASLKAAQTLMVKNLAKQLAPEGITVNNLAPGVINTDRSKARLTDAAYLEKVLSWIPSGRLGEAVECAGAALLLCSDAGSYITGQNLYVDGGMSL